MTLRINDDIRLLGKRICYYGNHSFKITIYR